MFISFHGSRYKDSNVDRFIADVGRYYADPEALAAGLRLEVLIVDHRQPIVDIIRRPPPARFLSAANPITFQEDAR